MDANTTLNDSFRSSTGDIQSPEPKRRSTFVGIYEPEKKPRVTLTFDENENIGGAKGCGTRTCLFTRYALNDVSKNKCHFCLAFCSVMIVVLSTLVINTIIDKGPLAFLGIGEMETGQIDAIFSPANKGIYSDTPEAYCYYQSGGQFFNYT